MDKNTVLALVLSACVLFGYDAFFGAPKRAEMLKKRQTIVNAEDTTKVISDTKEVAKTVVTPSVANFKLEDNNLSTKKTEVAVSNMGGALHNVRIGSAKIMPLNQILTVSGYDNAQFKTTALDSNRAVYEYKNDRMEIKKTVEMRDEHYMNVRMEIKSDKDVKINLFNIDFTNRQTDPHENGLFEMFTSMDKKVVRRGNAHKFENKDTKTTAGDLDIVGFRDHFNIFVIHPEFKTKTIDVNKVADNQLSVAIAPGGSGTYDFSVYVGPQDSPLMKKYEKGFEKGVAFSRFWILNTISLAIYYTIPFLHNISHSWGISIILISLIIYGLSYPLTVKSMMSMRKMQLMQPKIKALQDKYKNDPQKLNAEIMGIYRQEKINPLGGCLPFLLQMPLFISLYQVLWRAHYFQGQSFLWIKDLSQPDRLFIMPFSLPFLGNEFNILPLLMGGVMFLQQRISAKNMVITDEQQALQQKLMMYFFPIFIAFIFYKFASGLSLYFTVFYALSAWTQMKMNKTK